MRYVVELGAARHTVIVGGDSVVYQNEEHVGASLSPAGADPVVMVRIGSEHHRVVVKRHGTRGRYTLWIDGHRFDAEALDERARSIRDLAASMAGPAGPAPILAPMPGLIVRVNVSPGDRVEAGQGVVVMEAMKMENELRAPASGVVRSVEVQAGTAVEKGALLVSLE